MKLSANQIRLLKLVDSRTVWEGNERPGSVLACYFVPSHGSSKFDTYGGGDANSFKALERKRFIKRQPKGGDYAYSITEDGIAALARLEP